MGGLNTGITQRHVERSETSLRFAHMGHVGRSETSLRFAHMGHVERSETFLRSYVILRSLPLPLNDAWWNM